MATPAAPRRNAPCPCGSGKRYKECHGRLADAPAPPPDAAVARALQHHREGRLDAAERDWRGILQREPGHAVATHYLGMVLWAKGDPAAAETLLRASIAADGSIPDFHNNLALLLRDTGRTGEAIAGFRRALEVDPGWYEAHNNLGLALESAHEFEAAEAQYRRAIAREPGFAAAHQNLGRLLMLHGRFGEAWEQYRWRLVAQGLSARPPLASDSPLPAALEGRRFALLAEQGLGDVLFFLRFAPELVRRGASLAFRGDARLHGLLTRTGHFALGCAPEGEPVGTLEPLWVGDLPWSLGAAGASAPPVPLRLQALPERIARQRARLPRAAGRPCTAITWRSGVVPVGPARVQLKEIPLAALGEALRGCNATWISIQRNPRPGEREALEQALGAPVSDFAAVNDDLEDALALLSLVDHYAGTSNANTHLYAALGRGQHVFVPDPPEWRWMAQGDASPWFPGSRVYRPGRDAWKSAFAQLRRDLERPGP